MMAATALLTVLALGLCGVLTALPVAAQPSAPSPPTAGELRGLPAPADAAPVAPAPLSREQQDRRIIGLPVNVAIVIGGVLVVLLVIAAFVVPRVRRRAEARGGGTYGRAD
jgi:hypothetical protein